MCSIDTHLMFAKSLVELNDLCNYYTVIREFSLSILKSLFFHSQSDNVLANLLLSSFDSNIQFSHGRSFHESKVDDFFTNFSIFFTKSIYIL